MKIAVVGGGVTGLFLAYRLSGKGHRVTVFEKEKEAGGIVSTFDFEGVRLEKFYHHFFSNDSHLIGLLGELGLSDRMVWARSSMGFYTGGKLFPFTSPLDLLSFPAIPLAARLRTGLLTFKSKAVRDWRELAGISGKEWLLKEIGEEAYRVVWEPLLVSKFGRFHEQVPASWIWARLAARARSRKIFSERLGYLKGSLRELVGALAQKIQERGGEILLSTPVTDLSRLAAFDKIIFTMAPPLVDRIVRLKKFPDYLGDICVVLKFSRPLSRFYWINIGDRALPFCAVVEQNNAFDEEKYRGKRAVYLSNYLDRGDPLWKKRTAKYTSSFCRDCGPFSPGSRRRISRSSASLTPSR